VIDLARRATDPELLDEGVPENEVISSLGDLRFVNRWLGGTRLLMRAAAPYLRGARRILDVGCGSADLTAALLARSPKGALAVGLDWKTLHLRQAPPTVTRVAGDAARLPFPEGTFDIVTANLFLHHFDAPKLPVVLRGLYAVTRGVLIVNDLRRALVPYLFAQAVFPFVFASKVSVHDGLVSIRRSFRREELLAGFEEAGIPSPRVYGGFPYRILAVCEKR
jgi:ubiquinone/menaquinone biosynthesis C-methylase UbiE